VAEGAAWSEDRQGGADAFAWPRLFLLRSCRGFGVPPVSLEREVRDAAAVERLARTNRSAAGNADGLAARDRGEEGAIFFDRTFAMRRNLSALGNQGVERRSRGRATGWNALPSVNKKAGRRAPGADGADSETKLEQRRLSPKAPKKSRKK